MMKKALFLLPKIQKEIPRLIKKIGKTRSADSVRGSTLDDQSKRGGSIPASALYFHTNRRKDMSRLVKKYHYSHRPAANIQFVGIFTLSGGLLGDNGKVVAGASFSIPPTRWSEPILELSRLVRINNIQVPLTKLISLCCLSLRKQNKWDLIVSYADMTQGHEGIVYQAASWKYGGFRKIARDGNIINGIFYPCRTCNSVFGTSSVDKLHILYPKDQIIAHYDKGKHLYWKTLNKKGAEKAVRLGLSDLPYNKKKIKKG